jgi:methionine-gamma-lyase
MSENKNKISKASICVHSGEDKMKYANAVVQPIFNTTTYVFKDMGELRKYREGDESLYLYSRYTNPTVEAVEQKIALLEGGEKCLVTSSGMGAISTAVMGTLHKDDHLVSSPSIYGGTYSLFNDLTQDAGLQITLADSPTVDDMRKAIQPNTKILYTESPINPNLNMVDLTGMADLAHECGAILIIDNTFATPINQNPIEHGVDVVIHSGTKYLGGHSDVVCGAIVGTNEHLEKMYRYRKFIGTVLDPQAAFMLLRGMKTLEIRVERQNHNGLKVAEFLDRHPKVRKVRYPGLKSSPFYALAQKQMTGYGGMVCFEIDGGVEAVGRVIEAMKLFIHATSLGSVESLVSIPVLTSHIHFSPDDLARADVNDCMIRLSCGIEDAADLINDLDQALSVL